MFETKNCSVLTLIINFLILTLENLGPDFWFRSDPAKPHNLSASLQKNDDNYRQLQNIIDNYQQLQAFP